MLEYIVDTVTENLEIGVHQLRVELNFIYVDSHNTLKLVYLN